MVLEVHSLSAFEIAQKRFDTAADVVGLADATRCVLREPKRELTVHFPVRHDDGSVHVYTGYRVQHNISRGPAKGGLRYSPDLTLDTEGARAGWVQPAGNLGFGECLLKAPLLAERQTEIPVRPGIHRVKTKKISGALAGDQKDRSRGSLHHERIHQHEKV